MYHRSEAISPQRVIGEYHRESGLGLVKVLLLCPSQRTPADFIDPTPMHLGLAGLVDRLGTAEVEQAILDIFIGAHEAHEVRTSETIAVHAILVGAEDQNTQSDHSVEEASHLIAGNPAEAGWPPTPGKPQDRPGRVLPGKAVVPLHLVDNHRPGNRLVPRIQGQRPVEALSDSFAEILVVHRLGDLLINRPGGLVSCRPCRRSTNALQKSWMRPGW